MKRFYLLILSFLLVQFSFAQDDQMMRIMNLNTSTINIGGKNLKVTDQFSSNSTIKWSSPNQVMECKGLTTGKPYTFSYQQFQSKGVINTVKDYLFRLGQASTRGTNTPRPSFSPGRNKSAFSEKRCALVIGNSIYSEIASLRNPVKDAGDISAQLMDYGFDVMTGYDCGFAQMNTLLNSFSSRAREYDVALIFYSGHGIQEKGLNYLIPIDCPLNRREDLFYCIAGTEMVDKLQETNCPTRILILDACREIHTTWTRSGNNGLASMEGYPGMVITFSTRAGQTADDGKGYNSPFAKAFLDNISGSDSFHDMMRRVANDTYNNTGKEQYPVVIGTLMTNFVFNPGATAHKTASASSTQRASVSEISPAHKENAEFSNTSSERTSDDSRVVSATLVDDEGKPVIAAAVLEQGTNNGTMTDLNGDFSIRVSSSKSVIAFSCIGYQSLSMSAMTVPRVVRIKSTDDGAQNNSNISERQGAVEKKPSRPVVPKNSRINQSLASYYSFDNKDADDESGNNLDAVPSGGVQFVEDTPSGMGYAARLNGFKKGFINIPYNVFAGKTNYSISFWIKDFDYGMIVTAISSDAPRSDFPRVVATMSNRFRFFTCYDNWDTTERFDYDTSVIKDSEWHHVVVTCAKTDSYGTAATKQLYIDGRLVSVSKGNVQRYYSVHGYDEDIISKIHIGGDRNGAYDQCTSMTIDNVRFYTVAISKQTVQELYQLKL